MEISDIVKLAEEHGLQLKEEMSFNEMGIDFKIVFATAIDGTEWVLRIPRHDDQDERIENEENILELAKKHLIIDVPDWKIVSSTLIAYPLLKDKPALTFDAKTFDVSWNIDKEDPMFIKSLAKTLVDLHHIPISEAEAKGVKVLTPEMLRQEISDRIKSVKKELGIHPELEDRWRRWLDNDKLWPDFTTFIHGDLYAGHILVSKDFQVSGFIDWSEGQVSDSSIDFAGHISAFGEESLKDLINEYQKSGGRVWDRMIDQTIERHAAAPLNYGVFALLTKNDAHIEAAKVQLRVAST